LCEGLRRFLALGFVFALAKENLMGADMARGRGCASAGGSCGLCDALVVIWEVKVAYLRDNRFSWQAAAVVAVSYVVGMSVGVVS
jgi:hypothetical protein